MMETPNLEKLSAIGERSQMIGEFLDWLANNQDGYRLCEWIGPTASWEPDTWQPVYPNIQKVLAAYFEIDLDACEDERQSILTAARTQNLERELRA